MVINQLNHFNTLLVSGDMCSPYAVQHRVSTTIEQVQQQKYQSRPAAGIKRLSSEIERSTDRRTSREATIAAETVGDYRHDSKRPRLDPRNGGGCRLEASKIMDVGEGKSTNPSVYTQRRLLGLTQRGSQNPLLCLSHPSYDLPSTLIQNLASMGINSIYPWQSSCLLGRGLLAGERNLIYKAPTGSGKSLVADVLMLKAALRRQKAILVLPYVALVQEKLNWIRKAVHGVEKREADGSEPRRRHGHISNAIRIVGILGGSKSRITWHDFDIAVCTIEKANGLVNTAIEEGTIGDLGVMVLDELHMINDAHRGYLMELMATKLLCVSHRIQLVGMSATLSNTDKLTKWLEAKYYQSSYEPVPIEEYLVYDQCIYPVSASTAFFRTASQLQSTQPRPSPVRIVEKSQYEALSKPLTNCVVSLALETVKAGYSALIFCSSRLACQATAALVSEAIPPLEEAKMALDERMEVLSQLRSLPLDLDRDLEKIILRGVAFHHAGLTVEERAVVAEAYDQGAIRVLVATCSLAAGINLPARRVILQGARMGRDLVGPAMLRQMRGRAGRKGKDEVGESYVCCHKDDLEDVAQLLEADLPPIESCLVPTKRGIKRALLEVIAVRLAMQEDAVYDYVQRTLLHYSMKHLELKALIETTLDDLLVAGLISKDTSRSYNATLLGKAIVAASFAPEDGIFVHGEIQRALQAFVMDGEMHIFYMFTPIWSTELGEINWVIFRREIDRLDESGLRVLKCCGVSPSLVNRMANSGQSFPETTPQEIDIARIYRRFYAAFQLRDLCNEVPAHRVAIKFEVSRGYVQSLSRTCEGFAAGIIKFCERMGWGMLQSVLSHMSDRLKAGARADLLELATIPFVKNRTARVLWENGLKSLRAVADAEAKDLVPLLLLAQGRKYRTSAEEESKYHYKLYLKAETIIGAASRLYERQQQVDIEADL